MTLTMKIKALNRALIKRFELLPNISDFYTEKLGIHEYAAIYGIEKILRRTYAEKLVKAGPNKYLIRQYRRMSYYAATGEIEKYNYLSTLILKKSVSYRVLAMNRTMKNWFTMNLRDLRRLWRSLSFLSKSESSDLKFKRVWIDKKPGDYARPLGVPTPAWRCYSFMRLDHMERYFKGRGLLKPWQHGGRSGVGVLSCYKDLIPKIKSFNTIYEFDIKGFFDNINHNQITELFRRVMGVQTSSWVSKILAAKPSSYTLPPIEEDKAALKYQAIKDMDFEEDWGVHTPDAEYYGFKYTDYNKSAFEGLTWKQAENLVSFEEEEDWSAAIAKNLKPITIRGAYKTLMDDMPFTRRFGNSLSEMKMDEINETMRAEGRDNWKNLGRIGQGVPQGLGTSPFVSTIMTDWAFEKMQGNILMYMDDGLLFASSYDEMEKRITELKRNLSRLGLEIAPEKSKYVKIQGKWTASLRFLGLRYLPEEDTLTSETRSGTKVKFPVTGEWPDVKELAEANNMNISMMRKTFDKLINTKAYETGLEYGFLGCLIAGSQYKDNLTLNERREKVREGQSHSWANIVASQGFVWKHQDLFHHTECLTNMSSIASQRFLEFQRRKMKLFIPKGGKILYTSKRRRG
jgi:hypothetical protein